MPDTGLSTTTNKWFNNPPAKEASELTEQQQHALLLRHSPCPNSDCDCTGHLLSSTSTEERCRCSHTHTVPMDVEERTRRLHVASRIDELLYEKGHLEEPHFVDEDIRSLKKQMQLPEEVGAANGESGASSTSKRKLSDHTEDSPTKRIKPSNGLEDIPKDLSDHYISPKVKAAAIEEIQGDIQFRVVNNDNSPLNMIILTGLKNIFQKQLPKMPREYIARLIYDRNHLSMAIVRGVDTGKIEVIGGITYRPFNHRKFAEIVFCAIASNEQVRGYGAHLMNHLKDYVKASSPIIHFLTYADNYAIGYFKKQGFSKDITLDRQVWVGYIKDYEGGTIMQCTMLPRIRYLESAELMAKQKAAILWKIKNTSTDNVVYPGLALFKTRKSVNPSEVPGLLETGWTEEMDEFARKPRRPGHYHVLQTLLTELQNQPSAWPFVQPVNREEVPDYYEVILEPMDLTTMEFKLDNDQYESVAQFIYDAKLIFNNCRSYNNETTTYYKNASRLEKALSDIIHDKFIEHSGLL